MNKVVWRARTRGLAAMAVAAMLAGGLASRAQAQTRITGRVVDPENAPIPTSQVLVTGTTVGTTTSDSGTFTLQVPADGRNLTIRRIGFVSKQVPITAGQTEYTISLARDVLRLEAQVVTGVATTVSSRRARPTTSRSSPRRRSTKCRPRRSRTRSRARSPVPSSRRTTVARRVAACRSRSAGLRRSTRTRRPSTWSTV